MKNAKKTAQLHVVLDTNVIVSSLQFPKGSLAQVWHILDAGHFRLLISPFIVTETARILRNRFHWQDPKLQTTLKAMVKKAKLVNPCTVPDAVPNDADDNHIVACALEGRADLIVSGDRHLLSLAEYEGIPIIRPVDFLRTVNTP
jgi:putative PIN family toxin of toxin-antitoxin system